MAEEQKKSGHRSIKDFAHLFLSNLPGTEETTGSAAQNSKPETKDPEPDLEEILPVETKKPGNTLVFVDGGSGWLRTLVTAEIALVLAREVGRTKVFEEGNLFPTVSGHLGRTKNHQEFAGRLEIEKGIPHRDHLSGTDNLLLEIPASLPAWTNSWLEEARLIILTIPPGRVERIRAFHQLKRIFKVISHRRCGVIVAEKAGSGHGREVFHRFIASNLSENLDDLRFLGALPIEPVLDRSILPERKPAVVWYPGSLTAAAMIELSAAVRHLNAPVRELA